MKSYIADSWIDDRSVLVNERLHASTLYVAAIKAARATKVKNFKPGGRKRKLHIRVAVL